MKVSKLLLPVALCAIATATLTGCKTGVAAGGEATIQIRAYKGGYGLDWLHEAAKEFQKAHPDIQFEFVEESAMVTGEIAQQEIVLPKKNQIDLYFITGIDVDILLQKSYSVLRTRSQTLLEPLNDIYESKAIDVNGNEEMETIASRMAVGYKEASEYDGAYAQWQGKMFTLPWANGMTGLFVNPSVLERYNLEMPLTSNEFTQVVQEIYTKGKADGVYPFSWAGSNAVGYWNYLYETWFAQYSTQQGFLNFIKCDPGNGDIKNNGYKVYEDQGILKGLEAMFDILDLRYSPNGSASKRHMEAQTEFVTGKTAFMMDGDWVVNEMKADYFQYGQNINMLGVPVLSSIGEEIGITDAQLHDLVKMIDEHKSNAEIKAAMPSLDDAKISRVYNARCVYDSIGAAHTIVIPSYADAKAAAKLFVRYLYSNDGCRVFRNQTYSNLPLKYQKQEGDTNTPYQQSLDQIQSYDNPQMVTSASLYNNVRSVAQMYNFNYSAWVHPATFRSVMEDKASASPKFSPQFIFENEQTYVKNNWSRYMSFVTWL